jgi:hypothetical protein
MIALKEPKVVFNEIEHTYTNEAGKQLSGVTALLKRQLFADKYDGISEKVLEQAAERGNLIHRQIEMYETFNGDVDTLSDEARTYVTLKDANKFETIATELLVSDGENVASGIDVVWEKNGHVFLCDIKTTSKLDMEYLSWQLSIYKYLLLRNNPDVEIRGLYACWLPKEQYGKPKLVPVDEKPIEWIKDLIETDARGEQWVNPEAALVAEREKSLAVPQELTRAIASYLEAEKQAKEMKEQLRALMQEHGITKWECDEFTATIGKDSETTTFDSKAFKEANPDEYNKYLKTSTRRGSFKVTLK